MLEFNQVIKMKWISTIKTIGPNAISEKDRVVILFGQTANDELQDVSVIQAFDDEQAAQAVVLKKGDTVIVNAGDNKGQTGKVLRVLVEKERAIVEGVNLVSKHTKPNAKNPQGGIVKQEASIHISNLQPVDSKSGKATRVGRKAGADGKLVRYSKKSGEEIK